MEEIRGSRFFLPPTSSRRVTSRAINETCDFGQFYYSTRHAKKNMIFLTTNSKPLYIYVYESQQQKSTHTHQQQHQICGKNNPISLSKLYNTPCIYTDPLLFFIHTHSFNHPSIHPSIHHKHS